MMCPEDDTPNASYDDITAEDKAEADKLRPQKQEAHAPERLVEALELSRHAH